MNFRQPLLGFCTFGTVVCGLILILLLAPTAPAASSIPLEIRTNANADASKAIIDAFIKSEVDQLAAVATVHDARESLIDQVSGVGGQVPSASYLDLYAQQLTTQLTPLLNNPDQTVRLNVAIIVDRVAEKDQSIRLLPITLKLLADKSDAVLIWGLRSAKFVLPAAISVNQQAPLLAAIKAQSGPNANPMLLEPVFDALCPPLQNPASDAQVVGIVSPELQNLMAARVEQFRTQVPPDLLSIVPAINFLSRDDAWKLLGTKLQLQTIQILVNLAAVAGERADASSGIDKDQLIEIVRTVSGGLQAIALYENATDVRLTLAHALAVKPGMPNVSKVTSQIQPTIATFPAWARVTAPPHIEAGSGGGAATTAPAAGAGTTPAAVAK